MLDAIGLLGLVLALLTGLFVRILSFVPGYEALFVWNPRRQVAAALADVGLTHSIGIEPMFGKVALYDSGLLIVANRAPTARGFLPFDQPSCATEEILANKGLLWGWWLDTSKCSDGHGTLLLNVHARCASAMVDVADASPV